MRQHIKATLLAVTAAFAFLSLASEAKATVFDCAPVEIQEVTASNLVVVRCSNSISLDGDTVTRIAMSVTSANRVQQLIMMAANALRSGKFLRADIPSSGAANPSGCGANCRVPDTFGVAN
jgi:hypothetical protein